MMKIPNVAPLKAQCVERINMTPKVSGSLPSSSKGRFLPFIIKNIIKEIIGYQLKFTFNEIQRRKFFQDMFE